jgi:hypothetical protein
MPRRPDRRSPKVTPPRSPPSTARNHGLIPNIATDRWRLTVNTVTTPHRDHTARIIRDEHYRAHRRVRARVEHVLARLKDWQILRQCRRRGEAINHSLQIVAGLWNLKTHKQLRVNT